MSIGQVNDENASVGGLIIAMMTMKQSSLIRTLVSPKILKVLTDHVLPMASMVERDLFTHSTYESDCTVSSTVFTMRWGSPPTPTVGGRGRGCQEFLHADLVVDEMLLLHGERLRFQESWTSSSQHFFVDFVDLDGD